MLTIIASFWAGVICAVAGMAFSAATDIDDEEEIMFLRKELERKTNLLIACQIAKNKALQAAERQA